MPEMSISFLLSYACPATEPDAEGWTKFYVETHCLAFWITARQVEDGVMDEESGEWSKVPVYEVGGWTTEPC